MTRAQATDGSLEFRSFGAPGASRTVFALRTGAVALTDPQPAVTLGRGVRVVTVSLDQAELEDPPVFGGETPAEQTVAALAVLLARESPDAPVGLVGERATVPLTVALAARAADRVDRLALVAAAAPEDGLVAGLLTTALSSIAVPTLVVDAYSDATAPAADARWYADRLGDARLEQPEVPNGMADDGRLGLSAAWDLVLAHLAPESPGS